MSSVGFSTEAFIAAVNGPNDTRGGGCCQAWYSAQFASTISMVSGGVSQLEDLSLTLEGVRRNRHATETDAANRLTVVTSPDGRSLARAADSCQGLTVPAAVTQQFAGANPSFVMACTVRAPSLSAGESYTPLCVIDATTAGVDSPLIIAGSAARTSRGITGNSWAALAKTAPLTATSQHGVAELNGYVYLAGGITSSGRTNSVWRTSDGKTWTLLTKTAPFTATTLHAFLSFGGKLWVIGGLTASGDSNDVWWSTDGESWTLCAKTTPFTACQGLAGCVYAGKMWISGGTTSGGTRNNRVYYSTDGATWTACTVSGLTARHQAAMIPFQNRLWILGGYTTAANSDAIWSIDGGVWHVCDKTVPFTAEYAQRATAINGGLCLAGGYQTALTNDVFATCEASSVTDTTTTTRDTYLVVVDGTTRTLYKNGVLLGTGTQDATLTMDGTLSRILGGASGGPAAELFDLKIYTPQSGQTISDVETHARRAENWRAAINAQAQVW